MSQDSGTNSGGSTGLAFIVGALVVVVAILAYLFFGGEVGDTDDVTISIEGAAEAVEGGSGN